MIETKQILNFLEKEANIDNNDTVVVACSGGPDSMALLNLTIEYRNKKDIKIVCAHVNHNVREASKDEKIFVEEFCKRNNVIFEYMVIEHYGDDNFHNEARTIRYNYFEDIVNKYNAKYLFTAHHGDDLIETILMRINRGSTLRGYSGFSRILKLKDYMLVRPLITMTKKEILKYNEENNIDYVTDESNKKDVYTRNRYRKYIVSEIKKEDELAHKKFLKFSNTLQEYSNYIDKITKNKKEEMYINNKLNIDKFNQEEHIIKTNILYNILEELYKDDLMLVTDKHVELLFELIDSNRPNSKLHLPNNLIAIRRYNEVEFTKEDIEDSLYEIELIDQIQLTNGKTIEIVKESDMTNNFICRLDSNEIKLPLYVRNRREGDKIEIKGLNGSKKIKDIFINEKITSDERMLWPIVLDSNENIVWLPGLKKSKFDKTKEEKYDIIIKYY